MIVVDKAYINIRKTYRLLIKLQNFLLRQVEEQVTVVGEEWQRYLGQKYRPFDEVTW